MPDYSGLPLNTPTVVEDTAQYQKWANRSAAGWTEWVVFKAGMAPPPDPPAPPALSMAEALGGAAGMLLSTFPRALVSNNAVAALVSGQLMLAQIPLPAGMKVSAITWWSGQTAAVTPTNQWAALFDVNRLLLGISADALTGAWALNSAKKFTLTTPYTVQATGLYYLGLMVKATTVPSLSGQLGIATGPRAAAPIPQGGSTTGLTTPATCPATAGVITPGSSILYAEVS